MKGTMLLVFTFFFCLHKGAPCGEKKTVSGTVGGHVTLHVEAAMIEYISWVVVTSDTRFLAKTEPGKPAAVRHTAYKGRLKVTADGSLIISRLTREDQGQYTANVQRFTLGQCLQTFDLRVFDPLPGAESCAGRTNVSGVEGGEATLPLDLIGFSSITWVNVGDLVHFAVTVPGKPVLVQDDRYKGRLSVTSNGSLIITGLTREDRGAYGSYVVTPTSWRCAQHYNLTVLALKEEVIGNGVKHKSQPDLVTLISCTQSREGYVTYAATVGEDRKNFTGQEFNQTQTPLDCAAVNVIRLTISGWVLLITCCVLTHHIRTEVMSPSTEVRRHRRCS